MTGNDAALFDLLRLLERRGYRFVTPTPDTHARVVGRPGREVGRTLTDLLGWSRPFRAGLDPAAETLLHAAGAIEPVGAMLRATVRVSSLHERLFLHSAYPTDAADAVFFGPDSYRFADLIRAELRRVRSRRALMSWTSAPAPASAGSSPGSRAGRRA